MSERNYFPYKEFYLLNFYVILKKVPNDHLNSINDFLTNCNQVNVNKIRNTFSY